MRKSHIAMALAGATILLGGCSMPAAQQSPPELPPTAPASTSTTAPGEVSGMGGTRAVIYSSLEEMARASSDIVYGVVLKQVIDDQDTVSTIKVSAVPKYEALSAEKRAGSERPTPGSTIEVRQLGTREMVETTAAILNQGENVALFLRPTRLDGDKAAQFYITGGDAGIYVDKNGKFERYVTSTGDKLPAILAL